MEGKSMKGVLIFLVFFSSLACFSQEKSLNLEHTKNLSYKEITDIIGQVSKDTLMSRAYIEVYIAKAIKEHGIFEEAHGYTLLSSYEKNDLSKIKLLDNAIALTLNKDSNFFPMLPFFYKGNYYLKTEEYNKSLESYFEALKYSRINNNISYQFAAKHNIAIIKGEIGKEEEALDILKDCLSFEKDKEIFNAYAYSETLYYLAKYSNKIGLNNSAKTYIEDGLARTKGLYQGLYDKLILEKGIYFLANKDYNSARKSILISPAGEKINTFPSR